MATTGKGIFYPTVTDTVKPASRDMRQLAQTTDVAIETARQQAVDEAKWARRSLTNGEDMNTVTEPGLYWSNSYALSNTLINAPRYTGAVERAVLEVKANAVGQTKQVWIVLGAAGTEQIELSRRRDSAGTWSDWERSDARDTQPYAGLPGTATHQSQEGTLRLIAGMTEDNGEPWRWIAPAGTQLVTPTHEGSGQATHPSVLYFPNKWNGWHYWMAMTPYPWGQEAHEDPDILVSDDGDTWQVPVGLTNPLDNQPGAPGPHNSDTHLVMLPDGRMMVTWRMVDRPNDNTNIFYQRISSNGVTWSAKQVLFRATASTGFVSQALVRLDDKWRLYGVASGTIIYYESSAAVPGEDDWGPRITCPNTGAGIARRWWHLDVQLVDGKWWMLVSDVRRGSTADGNLYLGVSDDGHTWNISPTPIVPKIAANHDTLYKAGFVVTSPSSIDIWYSAFRRDSIEWRIYRTTANRITPSEVALALPTATPTSDGLMLAADKAKLDKLSVDYDSGPRNITALFSEVTEGVLTLSRGSSIVILEFDSVKVPDASGLWTTFSYQLPTGFRSSSGRYQFDVLASGSSATVETRRIRVDWVGRIIIYGLTGSDVISGRITYRTSDAPPVTAPGTPT